MKTSTPAADAAILANRTIVSGAVKIVGSLGNILLWGGYGPLTLAGEAYAGIGDRGLVNAGGTALGGSAQSWTLTVSGVDPDTLAILDLTALRNAPCVVWELEFDADGVTLLNGGTTPARRGRIETCRRRDTIGGEATIVLTVGTAARTSGRKTGRTRSDADQRRIRGTDPGFQAVAIAATKTVNWAGKPPSRAGSVIPNVYGGGGGGGGGLGGGGLSGLTTIN